MYEQLFNHIQFGDLSHQESLFSALSRSLAFYSAVSLAIRELTFSQQSTVYYENRIVVVVVIASTVR